MLSAVGIGLALRDRGGKLRLRLRDVNLNIRSGEVVALLGPSGCGKSTIVRLLAGLLEPDAGYVACQDQRLAGPAPDVAVVFQDYSEAVFPWLSVRRNIELGIRPGRGMRSVGAVAEELGVSDLLDAYPRTLSGGQQQRVQLARVLVGEPRYLILDEPTASLDMQLRGVLHKLLAEAVERLQIGVLLVTHEIDDAVFLADHIATMSQGEDKSAVLAPTIAGFGREAAGVASAILTVRFQDTYRAVCNAVFGVEHNETRESWDTASRA